VRGLCQRRVEKCGPAPVVGRSGLRGIAAGCMSSLPAGMALDSLAGDSVKSLRCSMRSHSMNRRGRLSGFPRVPRRCDSAGCNTFRNRAGAFFASGTEPDVRSWMSSQLIRTAGSRAGWRVWDACAAPGGKSSIFWNWLEGRICVFERRQCGPGEVSEDAPGGCPADSAGDDRIVVADARRPPFRRTFDAVLVDAPCSGLGTLRRNPEIRWRMWRSGC